MKIKSFLKQSPFDLWFYWPSSHPSVFSLKLRKCFSHPLELWVLSRTQKESTWCWVGLNYHRSNSDFSYLYHGLLKGSSSRIQSGVLWGRLLSVCGCHWINKKRYKGREIEHENTPCLCLLPRSIPVHFRHLVHLNLRHAVRKLCPLKQKKSRDAPWWSGNLKIPTEDTPLGFVEKQPHPQWGQRSKRATLYLIYHWLCLYQQSTKYFPL